MQQALHKRPFRIILFHLGRAVSPRKQLREWLCPHALLSLHIYLIKLKVEINQHKDLVCRAQSHSSCCISFHQFIQCHVSLLCSTRYTPNNEMQVVSAMPWHCHSKQHSRASAAHCQGCNSTSAKNSQQECLLGLHDRIC